MPLTAALKKQYRTIGHNLNPIVTVAGNGLSESVLAELNRALDDHELIKVKLAITDRLARQETIQTLCNTCKAELIQEIGKVALVFRPARTPKVVTSNIR
ncbi:MAG: YhbY family RNA-binding protein [Marinagarivorans sp.]|nr:YhbY family RNA-binding protein [Marinagarivorans sp.]